MSEGVGIEIPEGSPGALEAGAGSLKSVGGALERVHSGLLAATPVWFGTAGPAYWTAREWRASAADSAVNSMGRAAQALKRAAGVLREAKQRARQALEEGQQALAARERAEAAHAQALADQAAAQSQIDSLTNPITGVANPLEDPGGVRMNAATTALAAAQQGQADAQSAYATAQSQLDDARAKAEKAHELWNDEGLRTAAELNGLAGTAGSISSIMGAPRASAVSAPIPTWAKFPGRLPPGASGYRDNWAAGAAPFVPSLNPFAPASTPERLTREEREQIAAEQADQGFQLADVPETALNTGAGVTDALGSIPVPVPHFSAGGYRGMGFPSITFKREDIEVTETIREDVFQIEVNEDSPEYKGAKGATDVASTIRNGKKLWDWSEKP